MLHIARIASQPHYTAGVILVCGVPVAVSIELPWRDNKRAESCIPAGEYQVDMKHISPTFGKCFAILDVPDRTHILMHAANRASELKGCISPGRRYGKLDGEFAVLNSRVALTDIRAQFHVEQRYTSLHITDDWQQADVQP